MAKFLHPLIFLLSLGLYAQEKENIISHHQETIVTDPSKGQNSYKKWTVFPSKDKEVRNITLYLTFECPDSMRCADWDYVDHIKVRPKNSKEVYEVARMLTPYGGKFGESWKFQWKVDVTDFSSVLRDSVEVDYIHTGYEDNKTRGWKVTTDFEFTYGEPVAEIVGIHKIYDGNFSYGDKNNPIENYLKPVALKANEKTAYAKVKVHQTGHGMDANGCGEFCDKYREILFNNKVVNKKQLWTECGDNPLYPQAGTWIFDRANWCPGYLLQPDEVYITPQKNKDYSVALRMEPYETEKPSAKELLVAYVIEYGKLNAKNDVTLVDILSPSTEDIYARKGGNGLATIKIKNNGKNPLKKLQILYGVENQKTKKYLWTGEIPFGETALLTLPEEIISTQKKATFSVELKRPNGKKDGYKADNKKTSIYYRPDVLPQDFIISFKTNNKANENYYSLTNALGKVMLKKDSLELKNNTNYRDTLHLEPGNYTYSLKDRVGNGLEFWYHGSAGRGNVVILDTLGRAIKYFDSDFGSDITYNFTVIPNQEYKIEDKPFVAMFPSRTKGPIGLDYFSNTPKKVIVNIVPQDNQEEVVEQHVYNNLKEGYFTYDLSYLPKKRYYLVVTVEGKILYKNIVRLKE